MKTYSIALVLILTVIYTGQANKSDTLINQIQQAANQYYLASPQQKVYLHTDKATYKSGENIWIKAYVFNSMTNKSDNLSSNLYIEFINPDNKRSEIHRLKINNGVAQGYIALRDTLAEGIYHLRAYTNLMRNRGLEFAFVKSLKINNDNYKFIISPKQARKNKKKVKQWHEKGKPQFYIQAEGGSFVNDLPVNCVYSIRNKTGNQGIQMKGKIIDENKNVIKSFESDRWGMGSFKFTPQKDMKYTVLIENKKGKHIKYPFPDREEKGITLQLSTSDKSSFYVEVSSNLPATNDPSVKNLYVIASNNGKVFLVKRFNRSTSKTSYLFKSEDIPKGIIHLIITDSKQNILASRLFMNQYEKSSSFRIENERKDTSVILKIKTDSQYYRANLSASVTLNPDSYPNSSIQKEILYASELDKCPSLSFNMMLNEDASYDEKDLFLMLDHGYRYEWDKILKGKEPDYNYNLEKGITITGKITTEFFDIPIKQADMKMYVMEKYNDIFTTFSGDKGFFIFDNLSFSDSSKIKIVARKPTGGKNLLIQLDYSSPEPPAFLPKYYYLTTISERDQKKYRRLKNDEARERMKKEEEELREFYSDKISGIPDQIIYGEELNSNYTDVLEAIKGRAAGVQIIGDDVKIRGQNTLYGSTEPLYLLDDMPTDVSGIKSVPIEVVERIEIFKGPSASTYGVRGANGIISVRTKKGFNIKKGEIEFEMLGYQSPVKFKKSSNIDSCDSKTLLWDPEITFKEGVAEFVLPKLPEDCNKLQITIEGIDPEGNVISYTEDILIR